MTNSRQDKATIDKLADKDHQAPISFEFGSKVPEQLNAAKYLECSAMTMEGVRTVFDRAILERMKQVEGENRKKRMCEINFILFN